MWDIDVVAEKKSQLVQHWKGKTHGESKKSNGKQLRLTEIDESRQ